MAAIFTRRHFPKPWRAALGIILLAVGGLFACRPAVLRFRQWRAERALEARQYQGALDLLQLNARLAPNDAETQFWLARTFRKLGRFDRVRECLLQAQKLGYPIDRLEREQWITLAQAGQMSEATPHLQELLLSASEEDGREICEAYVHGYCMNLQFHLASVLLDTWQSEYPDDAEPHIRRGYMLQSLMDTAGAVEQYRRGLELAPQRSDARLRLAQALLQLNRREEAERELNRLLRERPDDVEAMVGLARCFKLRGELPEARRLLTAVVERMPDHVDARTQLGTLAAEQADYEDAIRWLVPIYETRPCDPSVLLPLAQAYQGIGDSQQARELLDVLPEAEQMEQRLDDLIPEAVLHPQDVKTRYEIGETLMRLHSFEESARWLRSVVELDPNHCAAHRDLAHCYREMGYSSLAEQQQLIAEQLEPGTEDE